MTLDETSVVYVELRVTGGNVSEAVSVMKSLEIARNSGKTCIPPVKVLSAVKFTFQRTMTASCKDGFRCWREIGKPVFERRIDS